MINSFSLFHKILFFLLLLLFIGATIYFIINFKTLNNNVKLLFLVFLLIFPLTFFLKIKKDSDFRNLKTNYSLTKGIINNYFIPKIKSGIPTSGKSSDSKKIEYEYIVENTTYKNEIIDNPYMDLPNKKPDFSPNYLVIYEINNPQNSYILLKYPIKDESDFCKFEKIFSKGLPLNTFKR